MLIDSHSHLQDPAYDTDREQVLERARTSDIRGMIAIGCDLESSRQAVALAEQYPMIYATVGVHPHEVKSVGDDTYSEIKKLAAHPKVVAYGEIGLDYFYLHSPKQTQTEHFRLQIALARELRLPLVIHSRDAKPETLSILKEEEASSLGGVMHCFTGDLEMARAAIDMNFYISFSGVLTFTKAEPIRDVARTLPLERILLETDCPYLAPTPHRGRRNEPAYLKHTAQVLASLHPSQSPEKVLEATCRNTLDLFKFRV